MIVSVDVSRIYPGVDEGWAMYDAMREAFPFLNEDSIWYLVYVQGAEEILGRTPVSIEDMTMHFEFGPEERQEALHFKLRYG